MCQLEGESIPTPHRRTTGTKTSPYFAKPVTRQQDDNANTKKKKRTASSPYFLRSPASVYGSITTLGPLIAAWTSNGSGDGGEEIANSACCRRPPSSTNICDACQPIIDNALQHWQKCPQFRPTKSSTMIDLDLESPSLSCLEIVGKQAEKQVRHLCPRQCYLRAYSPYRDWWALRQAVLEQTDESVDVLLQQWTCCLENGDNTDDNPSCTITDPSSIEDAGEIQSLPSKKRIKIEDDLPSPSTIKSETKSRQGLLGTIFINKLTGMRCTSIVQVIRALSLGVEKEGTGGVSRAFPPEKQPNSEMGDVEMTTPWNLEQPSFTNGITSPTLMSPLGLLEELFCHDPWQLLLSTILLNRTRRTQVDRVLHPFLQQWPTPESILQLTPEELRDMTLLIAPLGFHNRRAKGIAQFTNDYVALVHEKDKEIQKDPPPHGQSLTTIKRPDFRLTRSEILGLYHCGEYCADAYQIFIQQDWENLHPSDHALRAFVEWKQSQKY